jgi:SHS2 domain-containing protein
MVKYRLLEHTADLGFACEARTLEELFETAALALADIIAHLDARAVDEHRELRIQGSDDPSRLRAFLDEVLFHFEKSRFLPTQASVRFEPDGAVLATLQGSCIDLSTQAIERVVKAVTYHGLQVKRTRRGFQAEVILDL